MSDQPELRQSFEADRPSATRALRLTGSGPLRVTGEVDSNTAPRLAAALRPLTDGGASVLIDLRQLTFIDVAGLHVLLDAARSLGDRGRIILRDPPPMLLRLLDVVGTDQEILIATFTDSRSATAALDHASRARSRCVRQPRR